MLYTVSEASKMLKVNRNYVYKLIKNGELEAVKIGSIKIKKDVLTKYVNDNVINERGWLNETISTSRKSFRRN